ncbi:MAG: putative DNA-binding domain-containing protein [Alphaproteobacteria bacterium]|nr:putative DNA-binding domain-containing protein [Alphaproteobacteria bacterium]
MKLEVLQSAFMKALIAPQAVRGAHGDDRFEEGFAIYRHAYRARLAGALRETYEQVWTWIGDDRFDAAIAAHTRDCPPSGWTLDDFGHGFAETLARAYPDDPETAELAWLEWELQRAFIAPDVSALNHEDFAHRTTAFDDHRWQELRLAFTPSLRTRAIRTNVVHVWNCLKRHEAPHEPITLAAPKTLAVWRKQFQSQFRLLEDAEGAALAQMQEGACFGEVCVMLEQGLGEEGAAPAAGAYLAAWIAEGLITDLR